MTRKQLGRRILQLRSHRGLTQEQLAEASAVSCQTIRRAERGAIFPSIATLNKLADGFGISLAALLADRLGPADDLAELTGSLPKLERHLAFVVLRALSEHAAGRAD
jgi:transcriptional regulator with XRE-family HTH domain